jgi:hypothetical protein
MNEDLLPVRRNPPLSAHQKLALAVIAQAFHDAADHRLAPAVRAEAKRFISGSLMLREWCDVAGIDHAVTSDLTARFLRGLFDVVSLDARTRRRPREVAVRPAARARSQEQTAVGSTGSLVALRVSPPRSR